MSTPNFVPTSWTAGQRPWNRSSGNTPAGNAPRNAGRVTLSVGNLPSLQLGAVLRPLNPQDDLLAEMLEDKMRNARTKRLRRGTKS